MDEEIYDDAEAEVQMDKPPVTRVPKISETKRSSQPEAVGMSIKERLAMLNKSNDNGIVVGPKPTIVGKKPVISTKPGTISGQAVPVGPKPPIKPLAKPPVQLPPKPNTKPPLKPPVNPVVSLSVLKGRKQSLKVTNHNRDSLKPDTDQSEATKTDVNDNSQHVVSNKDGKRFKKLPFIKKPGKAPKTNSLCAVNIPIVQYMDVETGVELRLGAGRANPESSGSLIKSMTEDEELEESSSAGSVAPPLPVSSHLTCSNLPNVPSSRRPPPTPADEELYDDATEDNQEVYEEFDDENFPPPPPPIINSEPEKPVTPEPTKKTSKAEKDKEKGRQKIEKQKEKQRQKEVKEQEMITKKLKVTDEEQVGCHFVRVIHAASGTGKMMLAVNAGEHLALIRKTDCPEGKWIVKNLNTQMVGLVEASNMVDPEEESVQTNGSAIHAKPDEDEEIYEEMA